MAGFIGVHLVTADMAAALDFYRHIGLEVPDGAEEQVHVTLDLGNGAQLELSTVALARAYDPGWRDPSAPPASALQFRLASRDAVDDLYAELTAAGYHGHLAPFDAFWGNRYAEVDDPDGNLVGFHSPTDDAMRSTPPM
jgi:uncharacterized glyoxalase superfamily protein PhnB